MSLIRRSLYVLFFLGLIFSDQLSAINQVKVATIGNIPRVSFDPKAPQESINRVISFWEKELNQVLSHEPDLIVLPEMCDRSAVMSVAERELYFQARGNQIVEFFSSVAQKNSCYIAFNTREYVGKAIYNTTYLLNRSGKVEGKYYKNYLTIGEMEAGIIPGNEVPVFNCDFGKITCAICFDLNFIELISRHIKQAPDIILFSSMYHGGLMQNYWAYATGAFLVSSCGPQQLPSEILDPLGNVIASSTNYFDYVVSTINLDYQIVHLDYNWDKLKKLKEKYKDDVEIYDPGRVGMVLVSSLHKTISAQEMIKEFGMETAKSYLDRSAEHRKKNLLIKN